MPDHHRYGQCFCVFNMPSQPASVGLGLPVGLWPLGHNPAQRNRQVAADMSQASCRWLQELGHTQKRGCCKDKHHTCCILTPANHGKAALAEPVMGVWRCELGSTALPRANLAPCTTCSTQSVGVMCKHHQPAHKVPPQTEPHGDELCCMHVSMQQACVLAPDVHLQPVRL